MQGFPSGRLALFWMSVLLLHCMSEEQVLRAQKKVPATQDEDLNGEKNEENGGNTPKKPKEDPILSFMFDGQSLSLRARILAAKAPDGAKLATKIFAAQYGEDRSDVDCATLSLVDTAGAVVSTDAKARIVDVPADESFLSTRVDGTLRTIIHGCLWDENDQLITRVSTTLMNAWDRDPSTGPAGPTKRFRGVEGYAQACIDEMGDLPPWEDREFFDCRDPSMDVVPITATDSSGRVVSITKDTPFPLGAAEQAATQRCDRPAWLDYGGAGSPCAPFTRIGTFVNSKGTRFVFICRRYAPRPVDDPSFDVIGGIMHNPASGKTCWLNGHADGKFADGTKIPAPNTPNADRFWMNSDEIRGQGCPSCHDSDPFVHTPWMDQVLDKKTGRVLVPMINNDPDYKPTTKYSSPWAESFMGTDSQSRAAWAQPQFLTNVGACGSCHRIGAASTLALWAARSVGDASDSDFQSQWLTSAFRTFEKLHWMPTTPVTQAGWPSSPSMQSMQAIKRCASNPASCGVQEAPR